MKIAKIVSSNSHIDYIGRVIDEFDMDSPPSPEDVGFADFVSVKIGSVEIVGVIYDSKLINPEYANFGPRLSPAPTAQTFTPDFISEQGILIGILLLGVAEGNGSSSHVIPRRIIPSGNFVETMDAESVRKFHTDSNGNIQMHYYSQIVANAGNLAVPLLETIITSLLRDCSVNDRKRLELLKQNLKWQRTIGAMRA